MDVLSPSELETQLNELAAEAKSVDGWYRPKWTRRIIDMLADMGSQRGHYVCAKCSKEVAWGRGWLCDLMWLDMEKPYNEARLRSIALAVESELGNEGDVWDDFQKLVVIRAKTRLIIFESDSAEKRDALIKQLKEQIALFDGSRAGDRYLFACWVPEDRPFFVTEYIHDKSG